MQLSKKQAETLEESTARINISEGAVRSGKTVGFNLRYIEAVGDCGRVHGAHHLIIGRTERTLVANILDPIQSYLGKRNFSYSIGQHKAFLFGIPIQLYGASDARAEGKIRGLTAGKVLADEITLYPPGFFAMLDTRMSLENSQLFGSTNPDSPFHELKVNYLDKPGLDLKQFHFTIDDNPFLPETYLESLKKNYTGLFKKRFIDGLWCMADGSIFDYFEDKEPFVIPHKDLPKAEWYTAGIDVGQMNAFVCVLIGHNHATTPKAWIEKEYYYSGRDLQKQKTDLEYCNDLIEFFGPIQPQKIFVDPSAVSFKTQAKRSGIIGIRDADNDVLNGIMTHTRLLKNGFFAISSECKQSIKEYFSYSWDPKSQKLGVDKPLKQNDNCQDAIRYVLHSQFGKETLDYGKLNQW